jgi:hypothetical protein
MKEKFGNTKLVVMRADEMRIHPTAQRMLVRAHLERMKARFNRNGVHVFSAVNYSIRGKQGPWIVDGQHRWRAMMDLGLGKTEVLVTIYTDILDDVGANKLFLLLNTKASVAPYDTFMRELGSKEAAAVGVVQVARQYDMEISRVRGENKITCVNRVKSIWTLDEGVTLDMTLSMAHRAWGAQMVALDSNILGGLGQVLAAHAGDINIEGLTQKLAKFPGGPAGLIGSARGILGMRRTTLTKCVAELIAETYNRGRRKQRIDETVFRSKTKARVDANHRKDLADKATCIADLKDQYAKHRDLTRRSFIKHSKTGRRYEKLWENFTAFAKEAGVQI